MQQAALIVQNFSHAYVRNIAEYIHKTLVEHIDPSALYITCDEIDEAQHPDKALVFLIGEQFKPFRRRPGCSYIYINFSVVAVLGNPLGTSLAGLRAIRRKRRLLDAKLPLIDMLLDYYPAQTKVLQRKLPCPVLGFDVAMSPVTNPIPMSERQYDVCFVGGVNDRRRAVCEAITARGFKLSPSNNVIIEDIVAQSRCCLNVHTFRSHHFEAPRFISALSTGTPTISEHPYGLGELSNQDFVVQEKISQLPSAVEDMLSKPALLQELGYASSHWYVNHYLPNSERKWESICQEIVRAGNGGTSTSFSSQNISEPLPYPS